MRRRRQRGARATATGRPDVPDLLGKRLRHPRLQARAAGADRQRPAECLVLDEESHPGLPARRRRWRLRPRPQRLLHLTGRHRELDRAATDAPPTPRSSPGTRTAPRTSAPRSRTPWSTNRNSGKCLDVDGSSAADGADVIQWTCHGGANKKWRVEDLRRHQPPGQRGHQGRRRRQLRHR
jgi:hypothetical protein